MRRAGRQIGVVQVIGLDPAFDQRPQQRAERLDIVVDAAQQHRLAQHRNAGIDETRKRRARAFSQFARMIGMQNDERRLAAAQRAHQSRRDPLRRRDRHAGVHADHLDVLDRGKPPTSRP